MIDDLTDDEMADLAAWTAHRRPELVGYAKSTRHFHSTRPTRVEIVTREDNPMPRRFEYDAHTYECGGVMAVGAPLHNPRAVLRRQQRLVYMGEFTRGMAIFGLSVSLTIVALALLIRGIAAVGGLT